MNRLNVVLLVPFWLFILCLFVLPFSFSSTSLSLVDLSKEFCLPLVCGLFGRGENGIDLWIHTLKGAQIAISLSFGVCLTSICLGVPLGITASLGSPALDNTITLLTNLFLSFPSILIAIALSAFMGQGFFSVWVILSLTGWAPFCRLARAATSQMKSQDFVTSAQSIGCSIFRISTHHIFPNILPILFVQAAFQLSGIIIVESTLSFLGLGIPQEIPSLGRLILVGKQHLLHYPHAALIPGVFIVVLVTGFYLSGMVLDQKITHRNI